jgi:predicted HAD superfamily Cof-like phosphohydrolase
MDLFEDIKEFHEKFALEYSGKPRRLEEELARFRAGFLAEELCEYSFPTNDHLSRTRVIETVKRNIMPMPLEDQLDALVDLVYVALGTAYLQGFDFNEAWKRVHEANMKKIRVESADQSKRGSSYDVVKPVGWTAPDLSDLV